MRHRRLWGAGLLLGVGLLWWAGRSAGQPRVLQLDSVATPLPPAASPPIIATSQPMTPAPLGGAAGTRGLAAPIRQADFRADPPPPDPPPSSSPVGAASRAAPPAPPAPFGTRGLPSGLAGSGLVSSSPAPPPPSAAPVSAGPMVSVEVVGPTRLSPGQPLATEIVVRNSGPVDAAEVLVEEPVPPDAQILRMEPPGQKAGNCLTWTFGTLEAHGERRLKVDLQPTGFQEVRLLPRVAFTTATGLRTRIVRPPFEIQVKGPESAVRGTPVRFQILVANHGEELMRNIKLVDRLPAGLLHPQGTTVGAPLGDLLPGATRTISLETTAVQSGRFTNEVSGQADGGLQARSRAEVVITEPALSLRLDGPSQGEVRQDLDFHIEAANPGPIPAVNLRLVQALPAGVEPVAASTGGVLDRAQHALVWTLGTLAPGQRQTVTFRLSARTAGDWPLYITAAAEGVSETRVAHVLRVQGRPALTLEPILHDDSLNLNAETVYELHVFNQGEAPCANVRVKAWLPEQLTPLTPEGPVAGRAKGQEVQFDALAQLLPGQKAVYSVRVRGRRAGTARLRAEVTADRERPIQAENSIQVGEALR